MEKNDKKIIYVIYDGDCYFCNHFIRAMRIKNIIDDLILVNARTDDYQELLNDQQFDLNEGMLVIIGDKYYHAAEAASILAALTTPLTLFNKLNYALFNSKITAKYWYPICRFFRNFALKVRGIPPINQ